MAGTLDLGPLQSSPGLSIGPLEGPSGPLVLEITGAGKPPNPVTVTALSTGAGVRVTPDGTLDIGPLQSGRGLDIGPLQAAANASFAINASGLSPVEVEVTPFASGGELTGGIPSLSIHGNVEPPVEVTVTALSAGAELIGPPSAALEAAGWFPWWDSPEFALDFLAWLDPDVFGFFG